MQNRRFELISFQVTSYLIRTPKPCRLNSSILYTKFRLSTKNFQILTRSCMSFQIYDIFVTVIIIL